MNIQESKMDDLIEVMAEAMADCVVAPGPPGGRPHTLDPIIADGFAHSILNAIRAAGYAVVLLPREDGENGPDEDGQLYFEDYEIRVDNTGLRSPGDIYSDFGMGKDVRQQLSVARCRSLGASLLAAADAAENCE